jgi:hypothetical protein
VRDFFDPTPEQQNVILVDAATLSRAARLIESCELPKLWASSMSIKKA